jgi:hypothetical protein
MAENEDRLKSFKKAIWIALGFAVILLWSALGRNT